MKLPWLVTALIASAATMPNANSNAEPNLSADATTMQAFALPGGGTGVFGTATFTAFRDARAVRSGSQR
jgi:hypothetical protein